MLVLATIQYSITKTSLAIKWMRKKIPSCSNSALVCEFLVKTPENKNVKRYFRNYFIPILVPRKCI